MQKRMNDMERNPSVFRAPDGSGAGAPRDDDPRRSGLELGEMLEMGLESLLMHFRRKPGDELPRGSEADRQED